MLFKRKDRSFKICENKDFKRKEIKIALSQLYRQVLVKPNNRKKPFGGIKWQEKF